MTTTERKSLFFMQIIVGGRAGRCPFSVKNAPVSRMRVRFLCKIYFLLSYRFLFKIRSFALHVAHNAVQDIQIHLPERGRAVILMGNDADADDFLHIQRDGDDIVAAQI